MEFTLLPSKIFLAQLDEISKKTKNIIKEKLILAQQNPYRYKRIKNYDLTSFRIRFSDKGKDKRILYFLQDHNIKILCILDRSKNYKDIEKYLKKTQHFQKT